MRIGIFLLSATCCATTLASSDETRELIWRSERTCGINCVYVMLQTANQPCDYATLLEKLKTKEEFTSLVDLREYAAEFGMNTQVGRANPDALKKIDLPVIAHFDVLREAGDEVGHFVLVVRADDESVRFMDGTSAVITERTWDEFNSRWSGYILYRGEAGGTWWMYGGATFLLVGGLGIGFSKLWKRH